MDKICRSSRSPVTPSAPPEEFVNENQLAFYTEASVQRDSLVAPTAPPEDHVHERPSVLSSGGEVHEKKKKDLQIPKFDEKSISLDPSLNLVSESSYLLEFLQRVDRHPELFHGPIVDNALQRYEKYWLPLAAKFPGHCLIAPLDIDWVWCCHMLCPTSYRKDCLSLVGKVVDHRLIPQKDREQLLKESEDLWNNEYPSVLFIVDKTLDISPDPHFKSQFSYDIASAVTRQKSFYYQVSLPHYRDEKFLESCVLRYRKFLHLKRCHPKHFIVPCYDMDLVWHAHQLHPEIYYQDTTRLFGHLFSHDDTVTDRSPHSQLNLSTNRTKILWKRTFNEHYSSFGSMYRGESPRGKLYQLTKENILKLGTKKTSVLLQSLKMSGLPSDIRHFKLRIWYKTGYQNFGRALSVDDTIIKLCGNRKKFCLEQKVMSQFEFNTKYNDKIYCILSGKYGAFCTGSNEKLGQGCCKLNEVIENLDNSTDDDVSTSIDVSFGDEMIAKCYFRVTPPKAGVCIFRLELGQFEECVMPEYVEQMWGPITLKKLPTGVENKCSVASHRLLNHMKAVTFTCRIIHSLPLLMSAVQVFYHDNLAVIAHLIGPEQLPLPTQVGQPKACVTFIPKKGERAILIKNHSGDWGIIVGRWTGVRRPVRRVRATSTRKGRRGIPGCAGYLEVEFYKMQTRTWEKVALEQAYASSLFSFNIDDAKVELDHGLIEIKEGSVNVAENIALAFSIALLHVLCQPHPKGWKPGETENNDTNRNNRCIASVTSENLALVVACGFMIATPCNFYLRSVFSARSHENMKDNVEGTGLGGIGSNSDSRSGWWSHSGEQEHHDMNNRVGQEALVIGVGFGVTVGEENETIITSRTEEKTNNVDESVDNDDHNLTNEDHSLTDEGGNDSGNDNGVGGADVPNEFSLDESYCHDVNETHGSGTDRGDDSFDVTGDEHLQHELNTGADDVSENGSLGNHGHESDDNVQFSYVNDSHENEGVKDDSDVDDFNDVNKSYDNDGINGDNDVDDFNNGHELDTDELNNENEDHESFQNENASDNPEFGNDDFENDSTDGFGYQDNEFENDNDFSNDFSNDGNIFDNGYGQDDENNDGFIGNDADNDVFGNDVNEFGFDDDVIFGYEADDTGEGFGYDLDGGAFGFENDGFVGAAVNDDGIFDFKSGGDDGWYPSESGGFCDSGGGNDDIGTFTDDGGGGAFSYDGGGDSGDAVFSYGGDVGDSGVGGDGGAGCGGGGCGGGGCGG